MLEELQSVGLGWDHPYVQCRVQGALFSIQKKTRLPSTLCDDLTSTPMEGTSDTSVPLSFVGLLPTEHNTVERYYYPSPVKKQSIYYYPSDNSNYYDTTILQPRVLNAFSKVLHELRKPDNRVSHYVELDDQIESQMNPKTNTFANFLKSERHRIDESNKIGNRNVKNERTDDLKNRLKLYQLISPSEIDLQSYIQQTKFPKGRTEERSFSFPVTNDNGILPAKRNRNIDTDSYSLNKDSRQADVLQPIIYKFMEKKSVTDEKTSNNSVSSLHHFVKRYPNNNDLLRNSLTPFEEEAMLNSDFNDDQPNQRTEHVFTEGSKLMMNGEPFSRLTESKFNDVKFWKKHEARDVLANMLGFARSERLDVKKPGPWLKSSPLFAQFIEKMPTKFLEATMKNNGNFSHPSSESIMFETIRMKKLMHRNYLNESYNPHAIDNEYIHVFVKNP